jgi:chitinase
MTKRYTVKVLLPSLVIGGSFLLLGCNGGSSNGNSAQQPTTSSTTTKDVFVSQTQQLLTPISSEIDFSGASAATSKQANLQTSLKSTNSCIQLVTQVDGSNYTTSINSSAWWSIANIGFTLTNTCSSAQTVSSQVTFANLKLNGQSASGVTLGSSQTGAPYMATTITNGTNPTMSISSPTCTGNYCDWAQLAAGASVSFALQASYSGVITSFTTTGISLDGGSTPPPVTPGILSVSVNTSAILNSCGSNCNNLKLDVTSPAGVVVDSESITPTTSLKIFNIQNLAPGQYTTTISGVPALSSGVISYTFNPSQAVAVTSNAISTESVVFQFTPVAVTNDVQINLSSLSSSNTPFATSSILGTITNSSNVAIGTVTINLGGVVDLASQNLITGQSYKLTLRGLADPVTGTYYAPTSQTFTVQKGTTAVQVSYANKVAISNLHGVNFVIKTPVSGQKVSFGSDNSWYVYNTNTLESGTYYFPESDTVHVTPSQVSGYSTTVTPSPLIIGNSFTGNATVTNTAISTNDALMVGYLSNSYGIGNSVYTTVSEAAQAGYNTVVVAFATLDDNAPMQFYNDQFVAYTSWSSFTACPSMVSAMTNDITNAKKYYGLKYALVSVGGSNSTLSLTSAANPQIIAKNVVNFLTKYNLDGIDFDVEQHLDPVQLKNILVAIKALKPSIIITAAPQSNGAGNNNALLVTTGYDADYNTAITAGLFDYLWIQGYNTDGYTLSYNGKACDETMTCFIPAATEYYTSSAALNANIGGTQGVALPTATHLIIGEPATLAAAGTAQIWTGVTDTASVYASLAENYRSASSMSQYGGAMTWSINQDIDGGCGFADSVAPVVSGISASSLVCPSSAVADKYHGKINPNNC